MSAETALIAAARNRVAAAGNEYIPATLILQLADALEARLSTPSVEVVAQAISEVAWEQQGDGPDWHNANFWEIAEAVLAVKP